MFNCYNFMVVENRKTWKSTYDIEVAALEYENRWRRQMLHNQEEMDKPLWTGLLSFLQAPIDLLTTLIK